MARFCRTLSPLLMLAASVAGSPVLAQDKPVSDPAGFYAVAAVGRTQYKYDCYIFSYCDTARASQGKIGVGYRFGVVAVEAWAAHHGKATIEQGYAQMQVQSAGINAAFYLRFTPELHGLLRAGGGRVTQTRSDDVRSTTFEGSFGLGLVMFVTPQVGLELALDGTTATGENTGTALVSSASVGLRLRF
jgi:hypothetical protein